MVVIVAAATNVVVVAENNAPNELSVVMSSAPPKTHNLQVNKYYVIGINSPWSGAGLLVVDAIIYRRGLSQSRVWLIVCSSDVRHWH